VLSEALAIALLGGLLGLAFATLAIPALSAALSGMLPNLILSKAVLATGIGFALLVGACSGLLPGIGAMRLRVVDAFRRV
jgi:putative ABC transport system permease protein